MSRTTRRGRAAALAAAALAAAACGRTGGEEAAPPGGADGAARRDQVRVVNVEVRRVEPRRFTRLARMPGVAMAMRDVVVSAEEPGVVRTIVRDKGVRIRAGQVIVRLDDAILSAQVRTAAAQAEYDQEVWERRKKLYEEDSIGSELSYLEAEHDAERSQGNLAALQERLARTVVSAPIGGILDARLVETGSVVSVGTPVARIVQTDTIRVMGGAPERLALDLPVGASATVTFDVLADRAFDGEISYVGAVVDPDSRTFPIELLLPNPGGLIKTGMIADISVVQAELDAALVAPQQALVSMEEGYVVFVVEGAEDEARAAARRVTVATSQGNEVVVASGLAEGDRLVVVGQQELTDGDRVRVVAGAGTGGEGGAR